MSIITPNFGKGPKKFSNKFDFMEKFKNFLIAFIIGGLGGFMASILVLPFLVKTNFLNSAVILDKIVQPREIITKIEEKTVLVPRTEYFSGSISKLKNSVVAIESFNQNQLIRMGSGIVMTQDGLVVTLNSVVPAEATVIQVINSGKIVSAKAVFRDYINNLAIINIPENDLQAVRLKEGLPELTQNLAILSKFFELGKDFLLVNPALVSQVDSDKNTFKISAQYDENNYGAALIDNNGSVLGILDFKNFKPVLILPEVINRDLSSYFAKVQK